MRRGFAWRKFGRVIAVILLIVFVSGALASGVNSIFTIRNVEVSGERIAVSLDQAKLPKNLLFFPTEQVTGQILKDYPLVASVIVKKKYPSTLVITAVPRKPFVIVGMGTEAYAVDEVGVVLMQYPSGMNLPIVRVATDPQQPGSVISDQKVTTAIAFLRETLPLVTVSEIVEYEGSSLRALGEGVSILFTQESQAQVLARTLQTVITGFRIKGKLPKTIDLRFDKPVVTF